MTPALFEYTLHLADTALVLAQRNAEWTAHGPVLEQDIALTNIALDLLGQARNFYSFAATIHAGFSASQKNEIDHLLPQPWKAFDRELQEDDLSFLRDAPQYRNPLLAELPRGDWAHTILRQFFITAFQHLLYQQLQHNADSNIAAIAEKSVKETAYHLRWSSEWVIRLGDGTDESKARMQRAIQTLWPFTAELFTPALYEEKLGISLDFLKTSWHQTVSAIFSEATFQIPNIATTQTGGKRGQHTAHLTELLTEMQVLPRTYPNATW